MDLERSVLSKATDFGHFGTKMKVHMSSEVHESTEINKKATRDIESTNKVNHNHLKYIPWTLNRRF